MSFEKEYFEEYTEQTLRWNFWEDFVKKNVKRGQSVLEVGCAFGYLVNRLEFDYATYGIDVSKYAIDMAKKTALNTKFYVMDAENMDFEKKSFGVIFCLDVLEHLRNPEKCIERCAKLLGKEGFLIISVPNRKSIMKPLKQSSWFAYIDKTHISLFSPDKWKSLLVKHGFTIEKIFTDGFFDIPYLPLIPRFLQKLFLIPGWLQYKLKKPFLKRGENIVFICIKKK